MNQLRHRDRHKARRRPKGDAFRTKRRPRCQGSLKTSRPIQKNFAPASPRNNDRRLGRLIVSRFRKRSPPNASAAFFPVRRSAEAIRLGARFDEVHLIGQAIKRSSITLRGPAFGNIVFHSERGRLVVLPVPVSPKKRPARCAANSRPLPGSGSGQRE